MEQLLLKSWSHKTARWLRNVYTGLSNSETLFCDAHNKEVLIKYLAKYTSALQFDDKMIVSTSDDVLSSMNHTHLITTRKQIQDCSFVCVMLCKMVMTGSWYAQQTNMSLCHAGLWVAMGTGMQLFYIPAHLVYAHQGPDQSKVLTFLYLPWVWYHIFFSKRINKWLASKLINSETFLPGTSELFHRYTKAVP